MKNAHFKTCNNLIFANIHRWYKIHTIKMLMMQYCAHGTKTLLSLQSFSSPLFRELRIRYNESHESHMTKAGIQNKRSFRTHILKTYFLRIHTDKRETQFCIFPTSKWLILHFSILKKDVKSKSEWNIAHVSPAEICWKQNRLLKTLAHSWKCSQVQLLKSLV
jgi:hypothetical protein